MATIKKEYDVVNGPSKFDLMVALFEGKEVNFLLKERGKKFGISLKKTGTVLSVEAEDGSRKSWNVHFSAEKEFKIYFHSHRRKGFAKEM